MTKEVQVGINGKLYTIEIHNNKAKIWYDYVDSFPWEPNFQSNKEALAFAKEGRVELI